MTGPALRPCHMLAAWPVRPLPLTRMLRCAVLPQGVPLRVELGPKDMDNSCVMVVRRDTGAKQSLGWGDLEQRVPELLQQMQVGGPCVSASSVFEARASANMAGQLHGVSPPRRLGL